MRRHLLLLAPLLYLVAGCTGADSIFLLTHNGVWEDTGQGGTCEIIEGKTLPSGKLELTTENWPGTLARSYNAYFSVKAAAQPNPVAETEEGSYGPDFGTLSSTDIILEEAEVSYDFTVSAVSPSADTLGAIPQRVTVPVGAFLEAGSTDDYTVQVEIIANAIGELLSRDLALDEAARPPNTYPMAIIVKLRGRTQAGNRLETSPFTYPMELCVDCAGRKTSSSAPPVAPPDCSLCYPPSQDEGCFLP